MSSMICPQCHQEVADSWYFCANCGKSLRVAPPATDMGRQIYVYLVSLFLPPFGLWHVWKYLIRPDRKSKMIGLVALVLTVIAVYVLIRFTQATSDAVYKQINTINSWSSY